MESVAGSQRLDEEAWDDLVIWLVCGNNIHAPTKFNTLEDGCTLANPTWTYDGESIAPTKDILVIHTMDSPMVFVALPYSTLARVFPKTPPKNFPKNHFWENQGLNEPLRRKKTSAKQGFTPMGPQKSLSSDLANPQKRVFGKTICYEAK